MSAGNYILDSDSDDRWIPQRGSTSEVFLGSTMEDLLPTDSPEFEKIIKLMQCCMCGTIRSSLLDYMMCPTRVHLTCRNCAELVELCPKRLENLGSEQLEFCKDVLLPGVEDNLHKYLCESYKLALQCPYGKLGCEKELSVDELDKHTIDCVFRPALGCPYVDCPTGKFNCPRLVEHLVAEHGSQLVDLSDKETEGDKGATLELNCNFPKDNKAYLWTPAIYKHLNCHFFLVIELRDENVYIWVDSLEKPMRSLETQIKIRKNGTTSKSWVHWDTFPGDFRIPPGAAKNRIIHAVRRDDFIKDYAVTESENENSIITVHILF